MSSTEIVKNEKTKRSKVYEIRSLKMLLLNIEKLITLLSFFNEAIASVIISCFSSSYEQVYGLIQISFNPLVLDIPANITSIIDWKMLPIIVLCTTISINYLVVVASGCWSMLRSNVLPSSCFHHWQPRASVHKLFLPPRILDCVGQRSYSLCPATSVYL